MAIVGRSQSQPMKIGEVLCVNQVLLQKDVKPDSLQSYFYKEIIPAWNKREMGNGIFLFRADRGDLKGSFLLVCTSRKSTDRDKLPLGSPFTDQVLSGNDAHSVSFSHFLTNPDAYTEYRLIGSSQFYALPAAGVLGMHYIKVKKGSSPHSKFVRRS
jgi:hypothetical protein